MQPLIDFKEEARYIREYLKFSTLLRVLGFNAKRALLRLLMRDLFNMTTEEFQEIGETTTNKRAKAFFTVYKVKTKKVVKI